MGQEIYSLGFSEFVKILEYEAVKFGTEIIFVPQFYPSSQLCSECGYQNAAVKDLRVRKWKCPNCGAHHDRDRNAAKNILAAGTSAISGDIVRPVSAGSVVDARIPCL